MDELNFKYQQAIADRVKSDKPKDILRLELQILKLVGQFHGLVSKRLVEIVDAYHCGRGLGSTFEEGALRLMFIADYANAEEEIVAAAYAWLRQEINASRWIAGKKSGLLQPLMTVLEYKGFRALAMLNLPLSTTVPGAATLIMNAETGVTEEVAAGKLKTLAMELNLTAAYPYRLPDGRVVQIALAPTLEVHKLEGNNGRATAGRRVGEKGRVGTVKTPPGYYLTNVHDIMPAYPVTEELRGLLHFRPEFIESLTGPVAPGDLQPESRQSVLKSLRDSRLPMLLNRLDTLETIPLDSEEWRQTMHGNGLNMALLGAIAQDTKLPHVREGALIEMIARTIKIILRGRIRSAILHFREVQALRVEEELMAIVLDTVNGVLCGMTEWMDELIPAIEDRFGYRADADAVRHLSRNALLLALSHHCCIRLRDAVYAKTGAIVADDFLGFGIQLANGGNGPFTLTAGNAEPLAEFANTVLTTSDTLWMMEGRRAWAARTLLKVVEQRVEREHWDEALRFAELASALCPRQHPTQILCQLQLAKIKAKGPVNLAWRPPVLGEKPTAMGVPREELVMEELRKTKATLLLKIDKHFEAHHPLGVQVRVQLAQLMDQVTTNPSVIGLQLRAEALGIAQKVLGRRHAYSQRLLAEYAEALLATGKLDEAMAVYTEVIKLSSSPVERDASDGIKTEERAKLMVGLMRCWKEKGDHEMALEWALNCRNLLESHDHSLTSGGILERVLEEIAELSIRLYATDDTANPVKLLASEEILAEPIAKQLQTAIDCYTRLFDARRNRHDLDTTDGEALLRLVRKIVFLALRLAAPAQRPAIRAAARKKMFQRNTNGEDCVVRELLVRMVAGSATPQEVVERVLAKAQNVDTLEEAEAELSILLELIVAV